MARPDTDLQPGARLHAGVGDHGLRENSLLGYEKDRIDLRSISNIKSRMRRAGLRLTRQRVALAGLLFENAERHFTAEMLFDDARRAKMPLSHATVYNTLRSFVDAGLLRQLPIDGSKALFDTNVRDHHHFLVEGMNDLIDIPPSQLAINKNLTVPSGFEIAKIDVVVRLRRKTSCGADP